MRTKQSPQRKMSWAGMLITLAVIILCIGWQKAAAQQQWNTNGNDISNANTGNVGVGTTTPGSKLDVNGRIQQTGSATDAGYLLTNGGLLANTTALNPGIAFYGGNGVNALYGADLGYNSTTGRYRTRLFSGNALADVALGRQQNVQANPTQSAFLEFLTIRGDTGNVGIGTVNPAWARLQVNKTIRIDDDSGSATGSDTLLNAPGLTLGTTGGGAHLQFNGGGGLDLWQYNNGWGRTVTFTKTGNVGIGTSTPGSGYRLDVQGGSINSSGGLCINGDCKTAWSLVGGSSQWTTSGSTINYSAGNVGIGTSSPSSRLTIVGPVQNGVYTVQIDSTAGGQAGSQNGILLIGTTATTYLTAGATTINGSAPHLNINAADNSNFTATLGNTGGWGRVLRLRSSSADAIPVIQVEGNNGGTVSLSALANGNVGIGTATPNSQYKLDVAGNINSSGTITGNNIVAKYQDVAEWVESSQELPAGTVVVVDHTKSNQVITSSQSYDTRVAGVVSAQPGIALGEQTENKVLVATTGRVRIKVDATSNPIQVGDLLVTSDIPGVAMKSQPLNIGGVQIHRPGTIIGKALEPLAKGSGEILVLLSVQ